MIECKLHEGRDFDQLARLCLFQSFLCLEQCQVHYAWDELRTNMALDTVIMLQLAAMC